jgi:hypothetical protein
MPKVSKAEARRLMDEILREQMERPTLRPRDADADAHNPFRAVTDSTALPARPAFDERPAARV